MVTDAGSFEEWDREMEVSNPLNFPGYEKKLAAVAKHKQVLCVTHLPQIAAMGDTHLLIAKGERDGRTYTTVTPLDLEGRKRELARIIGGATITETTLKSAEEMLHV